MHRAQEQVRDFHRAMGIPAPSFVREMIGSRAKLRIDLIEEEFGELKTALMAAKVGAGSANIVVTPEQIDALCDLLYVVYGFGVELGVDLEPFFELVHEANMKKGPGQFREDGKKLKPAGWEPADLRHELARQMGSR